MTNVISQKLLKELGLSGQTEVTTLAGNANDNYLIHSGQRKIVVKCFGGHTPKNEEIEGVYRQYLSANNIPVAKFIQFASGRYVYSNAGFDYVALNYVEGCEARGRESIIVEELATIIAQVHLLDYSAMSKRSHWLNGLYVKGVCNETQLNTELIDELQKQNNSFSDFWSDKLPKGIIHGDLHAGNIILGPNDQIVSIID